MANVLAWQIPHESLTYSQVGQSDHLHHEPTTKSDCMHRMQLLHACLYTNSWLSTDHLSSINRTHRIALDHLNIISLARLFSPSPGR